MATFRPYSPHFIYRWLSDVFAIFNPAGFLDILQWDMLHMAPCLTSDHHHNRLFIKTTGSTEVLYMARVHDQIYHWLDWPCTENIKKLLPNTKKSISDLTFSPHRSQEKQWWNAGTDPHDFRNPVPQWWTTGIASISHFNLDLGENSDSCQPRDNFGLSFYVSPAVAKHLLKWKIKYDQYLKSSVHTTFRDICSHFVKLSGPSCPLSLF